MQFNPQLFLQIPVLLLALSFHEMAHAWAANRLGDPTARLQGRLTMNPLAHIDPFGTILFPLILMASGVGFIFGWARPTPVHASRFKNPRRDDALVALAGPISNLVLVLAAALLYRLLALTGPSSESLIGSGILLLVWIVVINLLLALFNLLPVPPLDGGHVLLNLLPLSMQPLANFLRTYGIFVLFALFATGATGAILGPPVQWLEPYLLPRISGF